MNFDLTDEQTMLRDALTRFLADRYGFEQRRALRLSLDGWSRPIWAWLAEQGYLAAPFSEADGGLGGGAVETMVIAEALGAHLAAEPYFASIVLAGTALRLSPPGQARTDELAGLLSGALTAAFCDDDGATATNAQDGPDGWTLTGGKVNVVHGATADRLVVTAGTVQGPVLFLADAASLGITRRRHATFDGLHAAEIGFAGVPAMPLAIGPQVEAVIERVRQHGIAWLAAEAVGIMRMLLDLTVEHLKTRKQFGETLGSFQALRHRAVDMLVAIEQAESAKIYAVTMVDAPDALERRKAFAGIKAVIGNAGRAVGQAAVQLHGGIGVTDEHRVGWGLRRLTMIDMMLGDSDHHIATLADLGGFVAAAE